MKLDSLYSRQNKRTGKQVLRDYLEQLRKLKKSTRTSGVIDESKITITIDDSDSKISVNPEAKANFVEQAKSIGNFDNAEWVNKLLNGLKQAGVQGLNEICEDERPVTAGEVKKLIGLLVDLLGK